MFLCKSVVEFKINGLLVKPNHKHAKRWAIMFRSSFKILSYHKNPNIRQSLCYEVPVVYIWYQSISAQVFSCKFSAYFQNTFSQKQLWVAASVRECIFKYTQLAHDVVTTLGFGSILDATSDKVVTTLSQRCISDVITTTKN